MKVIIDNDDDDDDDDFDDDDGEQKKNEKFQIHSEIPKLRLGALGGPHALGRSQALFLARSCLVRDHL